MFLFGCKSNNFSFFSVLTYLFIPLCLGSIIIRICFQYKGKEYKYHEPVQAPIAPPYAEALLISRRRAEKNTFISDHSTDFSEIDIEAVIEHENESAISGIKSALHSANNDSDNKPSTSAKVVQNENSEEETIINELQNLYQLDTSVFDYNIGFSEINTNIANEYKDESLTSEINRVLVVSSDNEPNSVTKTAKGENNEKETDIDSL